MKNDYKKFAVLYNFSYMAIGAMTPLIGQYLNNIGFSGTQIGAVTATGTGVAIVASAFWGNIYSKSPKKHIILMALCIFASIACFQLNFIKTFLLFTLCFGIMYFFQAPVMSLTDAFTVERMKSFGALRAWGAVGFASGVFITGNIVGILSIKWIFPIYIFSFIIAAITVKIIGNKDCNIKAAAEKAKGSYIEVFKNTTLRKLIICTFFIGGTNVANNTYFSFLYIEGGGTLAGVGTVMLLMVGSEVPFMAFCEKISQRITMEKAILFAMIISVIRFCIYGIGPSNYLLIAMSFSQGAVNGIILVEFVRYVSKIAPKEIKSISISAYYVIGSNLSTIFCQFIGGYLLDIGGASSVYMFFGIFNFIGVCLYMKFGLHKKMEKIHEKS